MFKNLNTFTPINPKSIKKILFSAIQSRVFPGCVVGIIRADGQQFIVPSGYFTYNNDSPVVKEDSIFDVASITKSIPTACLALQLIDQNRLGLHDPVASYLPELRSDPSKPITVRHLLTQTLDWGFALSSLKDKTPEQILQTVFDAKFTSAPGVRYSYSNATSILLGLLVEKVSSKRLDELADENFFRPLGIKRTSFHPEKLNRGNIVPTEDDPWRDRLLQGEIHDETAWKLKQKIIPGSAGLFSNAPDLLTFLEMLLRGGEYNGNRYFSEEMLKKMYLNQLAGIGASAGLGWQLNQPEFMGTNAGETTIGKTGYTGCLVLCDIPRGVGMVMLSNHVHPQRDANYKNINAVRRALADSVFA